MRFCKDKGQRRPAVCSCLTLTWELNEAQRRGAKIIFSEHSETQRHRRFCHILNAEAAKAQEGFREKPFAPLCLCVEFSAAA